MTLVGRVHYDRMALAPSRLQDKTKMVELGYKRLIFPLDESLGLTQIPFKFTLPAMLEIAKEASRGESYEDTERLLREKTDIAVNDDTIRAVTNAIGAIVYNNDVQEAKDNWEKMSSGLISFPKTKIDHILYLEVDGAMIATRQKDEKGSIWKENKLGMAFSTDNFLKWIDKHGKEQHRILKKEFTALIGGSEDFKKLMFTLALRNGYGRYKQTVLLSDGATWIRNMKDELFPDAQQILDYYHLCENVTNFAKSVFLLVEDKYKPWAENVNKLLKASKTSEAIEEIRRLGKNRIKKCNHNLEQYIVNNIDNIDYASYIEKGYFIGSGAIESANRTVLQRRLKQAGMRWQVENGQYVVSLSAKYRSDLWEKDVVLATYQHYGQDPARNIDFGA
jgi:hypothetical protein